MSILGSIKKAIKHAIGADKKPKMPKPLAEMGPAGATPEKPLVARRRRGGRGRDSTIISAGTEIGSRTLLG